MVYYRVSRNKVEVGSPIWEVEINPERLALLRHFIKLFSENNWTELNNFYLNTNLGLDWYNLVKEAALEFVRIEKYLEQPSRFENMMVFANLDDAINFRKQFRRDAVIYKIEYPDDASSFSGDMQIIDQIGIGNHVYHKMAESYRAGETTLDPIIETTLGLRKAVVIGIVEVKSKLEDGK